MADKAKLDEKWSAQSGRFYMTGTQALVKLLLMQAERDKRMGLDTAGFVSGYRGSPLGGLDHALWRAKGELEKRAVRFQPGLNEELAASMVWGSQQTDLSPGATKAGVFGMWYGKGPGVDRAMDAIKHANAAGSSALGGVLAIAGDDHAARSSTMPHQSDHMFMAAMMPTLAPSDPQEFIDLGLHGYAMSRYSGCWVGMLAVADTVESGCVVDVDPSRVSIECPSSEEFDMPDGGVSLRWPDDKMAQEARLQEVKVYAALAYARKNGLNKIMGAKSGARLGLVSCGKAWRDTLQALDDLGLGMAECERLGIRLLKLGMSWPLESEIVKEFADGLEEIMVVEEKRPIVEYLIKEQLYNWEGAKRPRVVGKFDDKGEWALPHGRWLLPAKGELSPADSALAIASRISHWPELGEASAAIAERVAFLKEKRARLAKPVDALVRAPHYCSGCPHNTSTKVPEGSRSMAGIGCHFMATWIYPQTQTVSQMGGEGVAWAGISPFTLEKHVFANLGDGTFWHSGSLAIRQSVAAGVDITYKVLHNDAVAMTGGQPVEGSPGPVRMLWAIAAEAPSRIEIIAEEPEKWRELARQGALPGGIEIGGRDRLEEVQNRLAQTKGVSILFYDQTCASEKRRRRKRGAYPAAQRKAWINPDICEGCGDCSVKSNCLSVVPLETPWGRKRAIDQNGCNQDLACVSGFCPSFATVEAAAKKPISAKIAPSSQSLPDPAFRWGGHPDWNVVIAGVGGTGVVTLAQVLGVAAAMAGLDATTLDQTGLAQKGGAVMSHLRLARAPGFVKAARVPDGECDALIAADLPTACAKEALSKISALRTAAVGCSDVAISSSFLSDGDLDLKAPEMMLELRSACREASFHASTSMAFELFGEEIAANFMLAGKAWQQGLLPIPWEAIMAAIEVNGAGVELNKAAFEAGRSMAESSASKPLAIDASALGLGLPRPSWNDQFEKAREWGGAKAEAGHRDFKLRLESAAGARAPDLSSSLESIGAARAKLAFYKDEYEVARLHAKSTKSGALAGAGSNAGIALHLAPPIWPGNPAGRGVKIAMAGWWALPLLSALGKASWIRGRWFDPFGHTIERAAEREDAVRFEKDVLSALKALEGAGLAAARSRLASLAKNAFSIRGYGAVKDKARQAALKEREAILGKMGAASTREAAGANE